MQEWTALSTPGSTSTGPNLDGILRDVLAAFAPAEHQPGLSISAAGLCMCRQLAHARVAAASWSATSQRTELTAVELVGCTILPRSRCQARATAYNPGCSVLGSRCSIICPTLHPRSRHGRGTCRRLPARPRTSPRCHNMQTSLKTTQE